MKQVVFAIALLAMASLTGCLNTEDSPVDENIDTTDDSTSDTTENNTDTTEDNSDTTDDTKDDELIEPVGGNGDTTIPEDSSVFMDSENVGYPGNYECTNPLDGDGDGDENGYSDDAEDVTCTYTYYGTDYFENSYNNDGEFNGISYRDADGIGNSIDFNGWVNKTGKEITIESLYYPDRGPYKVGTNWVDFDGSDNGEEVPVFSHYTNHPVSSHCSTTFCDITFYGVNGLEYNAHFMTTSSMGSHSFAIDYDNDGNKDSLIQRSIYQEHTLNFDLPFEPYGFSLVYGDNRVDRIF